jgi:hypothetical protein
VAAAGYPLLYADDVVVGHPATSTYRECYRKTVRVMSGLPGFHDTRLSPMENARKLLLSVLVPPISRIRKMLAEAKNNTVMEKFKLTIVILFMHYIWAFEGARLYAKNRA